MKLFRTLCVLMLTTATSSALFATTYYVDVNNPNAGDANLGTADQPLKTISQAATIVKPGDLVLIKAGTYRESVTLKRSGTQAKPIVFQAAPGERPIVSGADVVIGWRNATKDDVKGNPGFNKILVADLPWLPPRLYENGKQLTIARTPKSGWWHITGALEEPKAQAGDGADQSEARREAALSTFADIHHLTQSDASAWDGWEACVLDEIGGSFKPIPVASFDPSKHQITLAEPYSTKRTRIDPTRDRYFMQNHLSALDGPGQYVIETRGNGCRIFLWPTKLDPEGQPSIEAARRGYQFDFTSASHITIDGLECCFSADHSIHSEPSAAHNGVTIQNCYIHDHVRYGISAASPERFTARRNIIRRVSHGIVIYSSKDSTIEENEIGPCRVDGIVGASGVRGLKILRNYVHDNYFFSHPDNLQFWDDCQDVVIEGNLFFNGGSGIMASGLKNCSLLNNVFIGSSASMVTMKGNNCELRNNTFVGSASAPITVNGAGFTIECNIIAALSDNPAYDAPRGSKADYNLLWKGPQHSGPVVIFDGRKDTGSTIEEIRKQFNLEHHGLIAEPKFVSVPKHIVFSDFRRVADCTVSTILFQKSIEKHFSVGDFIEIAFDGVMRKVTALTSDSVTFDPPLSSNPEVNLAVCNWGQPTSSGGEKNFRLDLRLLGTNSAARAGPDGKTIGSSIDINGYRSGDFDGDGKRDIPSSTAD